VMDFEEDRAKQERASDFNPHINDTSQSTLITVLSYACSTTHAYYTLVSIVHTHNG
jgi:hypothetical protein